MWKLKVFELFYHFFFFLFSFQSAIIACFLSLIDWNSSINSIFVSLKSIKSRLKDVKVEFSANKIKISAKFLAFHLKIHLDHLNCRFNLWTLLLHLRIVQKIQHFARHRTDNQVEASKWFSISCDHNLQWLHATRAANWQWWQ